MKFKLNAPYSPTGDQPEAIEKLTQGLSSGLKEQVLLGVTGSGKTYTMANVIERVQRPTLVISHNKTLAAQLYQEFRDFFPDNAVSYFVSYYYYYQPEAYVPQTDTYIEKETQINDEIDKLRLAATTNLLTRKDTIVVASVSCIYNIGSPREYGHFVLELQPGVKVNRHAIMERLIQLQYERNDYGFKRGSFRIRGETIDIFPAYEDFAIRIVTNGEFVETIGSLDPLTGKIIENRVGIVIYPAKHYMTDPRMYKEVFAQIHEDLEKQVKLFTDQGKLIEAQRIKQRVTYDLEMLQELGYVNGVENYSRYFDGRAPGSAPFSLLEYFRDSAGVDPSKWLLIIDESHMSVPQIRGMYNGDRSRKQTLIDYGFRLPSALDNRPLRFDEFERIMPQTVYVSATPNDWELDRVSHTSYNREEGPRVFNTKGEMNLHGVVEQLIRPTGLIDPIVTIRPVTNQVDDFIHEVLIRKGKNERVLATTLTKRMAEDLAKYLEERGVLVHYLHSDILTLERTEILASLREGTFDAIIGVNLLREGLDLPEVSLVAILDADKEGFLRSRTSLIQTMGRAARHMNGEVILYADVETKSIKEAVTEVTRRRKIQLLYNKKHNISPVGIVKPIRNRLVEKKHEEETYEVSNTVRKLTQDELEQMTPYDRKKHLAKLNKFMRQASRDLAFEQAAILRDEIARIEEVS
jgi:excinuclease ABC subunit B